MENSLIKHIIEVLSGYEAPVLIIENNDKFLFRPDVIEKLEQNNINVSIGNNLAQRVSFELRNNSKTLFLINQENRDYIEDIEIISNRIEFFLSQFLSGYHIPSVKNLPLSTLDKLFSKKQLFSLSKSETLKEVGKISSISKPRDLKFDNESFKKVIGNCLSEEKIDWHNIASLFGKASYNTIGSKHFEVVLDELKHINFTFQEHIEKDYAHIKNSNPIKKPQVVSKILDFLDFNFKNHRIALIVVDGLSFWQYNFISNKL